MMRHLLGFIFLSMFSVALCAADGEKGVRRAVWNFEKDSSGSDMYVKLKEYAVSGKIPDVTDFVENFTFKAGADVKPGDSATFYGQYFSAVLCPPETGEYFFWFTCSGFGELRISNTEKRGSMADLAWVGVEQGCKPGDYLANESQKSRMVSLVAGRKYFIEAFFVNRARPNGHMSVAWSLPGESSAKAGKLIPAECLLKP